MIPRNPTRPSGGPRDGSPSTLKTKLLDPTHPIDDFASGERSLDDFLRLHALQNVRHGVSKTYVLLRGQSADAATPAVLGYYSLTPTSLAARDLAPFHAGARLPRYPLGAFLIGRLAVDSRAQGRGLGSVLLLDALARCAAAAEEVGGVGVVIDALNERACTFYQRQGFTLLEAEREWPRRLYLPMSTIVAALAG